MPNFVATLQRENADMDLAANLCTNFPNNNRTSMGTVEEGEEVKGEIVIRQVAETFPRPIVLQRLEMEGEDLNNNNNNLRLLQKTTSVETRKRAEI